MHGQTNIKCEGFLFSKNIQTGALAPSALYAVTGGPSLYLEADHSPPSSAQLGICGTCTFTPHMCFYCVHKPNLISLITLLR